MLELLPILASLIPTLNYGVTRVIDKFTGGPKPSNAQEALALKQADIAQLEALAKLDSSDGASRWVINLRALMRPLSAVIILTVWSVYVFKFGIAPQDLMNLASAVIFYLFGERTQMYIQKNK